jgi:hypothetical protein
MMRYVPPKPSQPQISFKGISKGYLGTYATLDQIQRLIYEGLKDFYVRQKAIDILIEHDIKPKDYLSEIRALFEWVQKNVRYTKDPFRVEVLHSARRMLELRAGDCDDITILLGSMLESIGHPIRLVIVGPDISRPKLFSHIYLEVKYKSKWIPLDATMSFPVGWAPRLLVRKIIPFNRRFSMMNTNSNFHGNKSVRGSVPLWLIGLLKTLRHQAVPPKDPRIKKLVNLLRQRGIWGRIPRFQRFLTDTWRNGRPKPSRPRKLSKIVRLLRFWKILPPRRVLQPGGAVKLRPLSSRVARGTAPQIRRPAASTATRLKGLDG